MDFDTSQKPLTENFTTKLLGSLKTVLNVRNFQVALVSLNDKIIKRYEH